MSGSLYVFSYDVRDDKRRLRVARALEGYGERVQYSVFELWLTGAQLEALVGRLTKHLGAEDSLRIYTLCAACAPRRRVLGTGRPTEEPGVLIL